MVQERQQVTVRRRYRFEAAHVLEWHPGKCRNLHGHGYVLDVDVSGPLTEHGIVVDFSDVDAVVDPIVEVLDHTYLNEILANPTAENLGLFISKSLTETPLEWCRIQLWETDRGSVIIHRSSPS